MTRYYFYHAELYTSEGSEEGVDRRLGGNHGIYAVEDDSMPDAIFEQVVSALNEEAVTQYEANAKVMNVSFERNAVYYVLTQFHKVD